MNVYYSIDDASAQLSNTIVTIGSFDGVHKGHRFLIESLNNIAEQKGFQSLVITFEPHPSEVINGTCELLSTLPEKLKLLKEAGVANLLVVNFTKDFSQMPHHIFVEQYLVKQLSTRAIIGSSNNYFGNNKEGSITSLNHHKIDTYYIDRLQNISSSNIRKLIKDNDLESACKMLSAPYLIIEPITNQNKIIPMEKNSPHVRILKNTTKL